MEYIGYIYKIKNSINSKVYIGQTSTSIQKRYKAHLRRVDNDSFINHLYLAMRKYGTKVFSVEIVEKIISNDIDDFKNMLDEMEKQYIKLFDSYHNGYNSTLGGGGKLGLTGEKCCWYGRKHTYETKQKMRKASLGKKKTNDAVKKNKLSHGWDSVVKLDLNGKYIEKYESANKAAIKNDMNVGDISKCCNGIRKTAKGFIWMFKTDFELQKGNIDIGHYKKVSYQAKSVIQYNINGTYVDEFASIHEASIKTNTCESRISCCCNKKPHCKTAGGYIWEYKE